MLSHGATRHRTHHPGRRRPCAITQPNCGTKFWQGLFTKCSYMKFVSSENQTSERIYIPEQTGNRRSPRAADSHLTDDRTKGPSCVPGKKTNIAFVLHMCRKHLDMVFGGGTFRNMPQPEEKTTKCCSSKSCCKLLQSHTSIQALTPSWTCNYLVTVCHKAQSCLMYVSPQPPFTVKRLRRSCTFFGKEGTGAITTHCGQGGLSVNFIQASLRTQGC